MFLQRYTLYFADRLQGKKRSLLVTGPPDSGKSFSGLLVRNQLPKCRVFVPLSTSEFRWGSLDEEMHLLSFCNDWRFSRKLPVQACLNWVEGLEFKYNRKRQKGVEGKWPLGIFTSNDMESGCGYKDVVAFYARMAAALGCVTTIQIANVAEKECNKRLQKCRECGARALIKHSPALQSLVRPKNPLAFGFYELRSKQFYEKAARSFPQAQCHVAGNVNDEYEALVAEAENRI